MLRLLFLFACLAACTAQSGGTIEACFCQAKYADMRTRYGVKCQIHSVHQTAVLMSFVPEDPWNPIEDFGMDGWYNAGKNIVRSMDGKWKCTGVNVVLPQMPKLTANDTIAYSVSSMGASRFTATLFGNTTMKYEPGFFSKDKTPSFKPVDAMMTQLMFSSLKATEPWLFKWKAPPLPKGVRVPPPPPSDGPGYGVEYKSADGVHNSLGQYSSGGFQPDPVRGFILSMVGYIFPVDYQRKPPTYKSISFTRSSGSLGYFPTYNFTVQSTGDFKFFLKNQNGTKVVKTSNGKVPSKQLEVLQTVVGSLVLQKAHWKPTVAGDPSMNITACGKQGCDSYYYNYGNLQGPRTVYHFVGRVLDTAINVCQWVKNPNIQCGM